MIRGIASRYHHVQLDCIRKECIQAEYRKQHIFDGSFIKEYFLNRLSCQHNISKDDLIIIINGVELTNGSCLIDNDTLLYIFLRSSVMIKAMGNQTLMDIRKYNMQLVLL